MKKASRDWLQWMGRSGCLALMVAGLSSVVSNATAADAERLAEKARELLVAVEQRDVAVLDSLLCMDVVAADHLQRKVNLGLVANAADPAALASLGSAYRNALYHRFSGVPAAKVSILVGSEALTAPLDGGERVTERFKVGGQVRTISAQTTLTLEYGGRVFDIPAIQIDGEYWCLLPSAIP